MKMLADKREISKIYKRRDRYEIPDWQRGKVWSKDKKQLLIDSILKCWKLPKFYFVKISEEPEEFEVVDGQQRLSAIFEFFGNELPLSDEAASIFGGHYYKELKSKFSDAFDDFEIEFDVIEDANESELKLFFQRLQEGLPLSTSERLNSEHSNLRDYCRVLSEHRFFTEKVYARDYRYAHFDIVAKVAAIEIEGFGVGIRYDDLKKVFASQASFSNKSSVAIRLKETFDYLDRMFVEKDSLLRNRTVIQSLTNLIAKIVVSGKADGLEKKLYDFFANFMHELTHQVELGPNATDSDYLLFQKSVTANVRSSIQVRHEVLIRKMLSYDPAFYEVLGPLAIAESGLPKKIREMSDNVAMLIANLNSEYSAKYGIDLIKPTNKTMAAITHIGKMITDFSAYKNLIDNLYFISREGVGDRLEAFTPQSFIDINDLRTDIRHDVDHGSVGKVAAKRKKLGNAFRRYSGTNTPTTLSPDKFPVVQANLLQAFESDLRQLLMNIEKLENQ